MDSATNWIFKLFNTNVILLLKITPWKKKIMFAIIFFKNKAENEIKFKV